MGVIWRLALFENNQLSISRLKIPLNYLNVKPFHFGLKGNINPATFSTFSMAHLNSSNGVD